MCLGDGSTIRYTINVLIFFIYKTYIYFSSSIVSACYGAGGLSDSGFDGWVPWIEQGESG